jgi:ribose/xylose/arabinose/galactoside ABC-type transport system permease subunit
MVVRSIFDMAMFMLYLVLAYLLLTNASEFGQTLDAVGSNWVRTLRVLQGR